MNPRDGDVIEFTLEIVEDVVRPKGLSVGEGGCTAAQRAGGLLTKLVDGHSPEEAAAIEAREVIRLLALAPDEERCALTAVAALRAALVDAHITALATAEVERR